ncbi:MAG: hypothetical protein VX278_03685, partial [Myxococcota bacterium]|nr:hypothetical protein [Myxococcota bacterium]
MYEQHKRTAGKFNKRTFKGLRESQCKRKLYLNLGNARPGWTETPDGSVVDVEDINHTQAQTVTAYGSFYEQVYQKQLGKEPSHLIDCEPTYLEDAVWPKPSIRQAQEWQNWENIFQRAQGVGFVCAFEQMWCPEDDFAAWMLGQPHRGITEISRGDRPDVLLVESVQEREEEFFSLEADGTISMRRRIFSGLLIRVLDIKNTPLERCEKHLPDVVYYIVSLMYRLRRIRAHFENRFGCPIRIAVNGNGILGRIEYRTFENLSAKSIYEAVRLSKNDERLGYLALDWGLYSTMIGEFRTSVADVIAQRSSFHTVDYKLSSSCIHCVYSHRCLNPQIDALRTPSAEAMPFSTTDSIATLAGVPPSIQRELKKRNIHSIGEFLASMDTLFAHCQTDPIPTELNRPLRALHLKALALSEQRILSQDHVHYRNLWPVPSRTIHLPPEMGIGLVLCVEQDPAQQKILALALLLKDFSSNRILYDDVFVNRGLTADDEREILRRAIAGLENCLRRTDRKRFPVLFWGGNQWGKLVEVLDKYPDLRDQTEAATLFFSLFPPIRTGVHHPDMQRLHFNVEKAFETLFAQPIRFNNTWIKTYENIHAETRCEDLKIHRFMWGEHRNYFDFSIWNLYVGEPRPAAYGYAFETPHIFSPLAPREVIQDSLYTFFAERDLLPEQASGWVKNRDV